MGTYHYRDTMYAMSNLQLPTQKEHATSVSPIYGTRMQQTLKSQHYDPCGEGNKAREPRTGQSENKKPYNRRATDAARSRRKSHVGGDIVAFDDLMAGRCRFWALTAVTCDVPSPPEQRRERGCEQSPYLHVLLITRLTTPTGAVL